MLVARKSSGGIQSIEDLQVHLQTALAIEHATIPPYFTAWLSANSDANPAAVNIIRSVMVEEMLHLTLAANLLNSIDGRPNLTDPDFIPRYPHRLPHSGKHFLVSIERFSPQSIATFLKIERPEVDAAPPQADEYATIGQFYAAIADGFRRLTDQLGAEKVFSGDPARQIKPEEYYGSGSLLPVRDLPTALAAIEEITEQGEGAPDSVFDEDAAIIGNGPGFEPAHYYRFKELQLGREYKTGDTPKTGPTGPAVRVHYEAVFPIAKNPSLADYPANSAIRATLEEFCAGYRALLADLEQAFNGVPRQLPSGMARMFALKNQALALMRTPRQPGAGETVGVAFRRD